MTFTSSCLYAPLNPHDDQKALEIAFAHLTPAAVLLKDGDGGPARAAAVKAGIQVIELQSLA
jgi:hypothetical protein